MYKMKQYIGYIRASPLIVGSRLYRPNIVSYIYIKNFKASYISCLI